MIPNGTRVAHKSNKACGNGVVVEFSPYHNRYKVQWERPESMSNKSHSPCQLIILSEETMSNDGPIHPLHDISEIASFMRSTGKYFPQERRTGRSTIQALKYIAQAMENPFEEIVIKDHHGTYDSDRVLFRSIQGIVSDAGFKHFVFSLGNLTIKFGEK